jgi:hypothetical protein
MLVSDAIGTSEDWNIAEAESGSDCFRPCLIKAALEGHAQSFQRLVSERISEGYALQLRRAA